MVMPTTTAEYNAYNQSRGGNVGSGLAIPLASLLPSAGSAAGHGRHAKPVRRARAAVSPMWDR
jgi:hypothetical protein